MLFDSSVGHHRDNFSARDLHRWLNGDDCSRRPVSADTNSQVVQSDVLLWAEGNAGMVITLSFPRPADRFGKRGAYIVHPTFQFTSERGTLFVFKWEDDLFFCHQADFEYRGSLRKKNPEAPPAGSAPLSPLAGALLLPPVISPMRR